MPAIVSSVTLNVGAGCHLERETWYDLWQVGRKGGLERGADRVGRRRAGGGRALTIGLLNFICPVTTTEAWHEMSVASKGDMSCRVSGRLTVILHKLIERKLLSFLFLWSCSDPIDQQSLLETGILHGILFSYP